MSSQAKAKRSVQAVKIQSDSVVLDGELTIPDGAQGIVLFAHGSGSSRHSPRNKFVAGVIQNAGIATLLFDLLTADEENIDIKTRHLRFDIRLLADRLAGAVRWLTNLPETEGLKIGLFGSSTGAAAALVAAAELGGKIDAVVSRGGRADLAGEALSRVRAPVLLVVGGRDTTVIKSNGVAFANLNCKKELRVVPNASHLFEEPGTLEKVALMAAEWFAEELG